MAGGFLRALRDVTGLSMHGQLPLNPLSGGGGGSGTTTWLPLVATLGVEMGILGEKPQDLERALRKLR
jgi:hypothetical protein